MDPWVLWIGLGWLVFFGGLFSILHFVAQPSGLRTIAAAVGLPITDEVRPIVEAGYRRKIVALEVSAGIGICVSFILLWAFRATGVFEITWGYLLLLFVAIAIGSAVSVLRTERERQQSVVRVARARAINRTAYLSRLWQWAARVTVGLLLIGVVVRGVITPNPARDIPFFLVIYVAATIAALVLAEVTSRWIVSHGQPTGSELELAWDDAFKSRSLFSLAYIPAFLGAVGSQVGSAVALPQFMGMLTNIVGHSSAASIENYLLYFLALLAQGAVGVVAMIFLLVVLIIETARKYQQHYLRTLWPELVPAVPAASVNAALVAPKEA
jgi:hypothetical protein